jgi:hypothetical protein
MNLIFQALNLTSKKYLGHAHMLFLCQVQSKLQICIDKGKMILYSLAFTIKLTVCVCDIV